jgi:hypothetical protein
VRFGSTAALIEGIRRVNRAPAVVGWVFLITLAAALPFTAMLQAAIADHLGNSLAADQAARGVNAQWWSEFTAEAGPLGRAFRPTIVGFAAVLDNLSALADRGWRPAPLLWLGAGYLVLWLFLSGGIIDRYARSRPTQSHEFFAACGVFFVRFLRLAPIMAFAYLVLFLVLHPLLFEYVYGELTREATVERTAFLLRAALYGVFGLALVLVNIVFDYAKVRAVVEDRRSMVGAVVSSFRFARRNVAGVAALYALNGLLFLILLLAYAVLAPSADSTRAPVWLPLAAGQLYLLGRVWVRLVFAASETALFQGRLAHAGYLAGAAVRRPEPPAVELLDPRASTESKP